jgi:hypothetical protein
MKTVEFQIVPTKDEWRAHEQRGRERAIAEGRCYGGNVVSMDPTDRLWQLTTGWQRMSVSKLIPLERALAAAHAKSWLPSDLYDIWLQVSALVLVGTGRAMREESNDTTY